MSVPEINGKPAAWVKVRVYDKINIGNYQNVEFEAEAGRYVEDTPEAIEKEWYALADRAEGFLAVKRENTLTDLS